MFLVVVAHIDEVNSQASVVMIDLTSKTLQKVPLPKRSPSSRAYGSIQSTSLSTAKMTDPLHFSAILSSTIVFRELSSNISINNSGYFLNTYGELLVFSKDMCICTS
mmetsp:Transcript_9859/g.10928  ORF Transcript_9859/g.10928 Transcript_9859/m.10928 type:complete len:107 (+) Transcript_9859:2-322(+)